MGKTATLTIDQELKDISAKVTTEARTRASLEFGVHPETINRYLRGEAPKKIFATKLLDFLRDQIGEA